MPCHIRKVVHAHSAQLAPTIRPISLRVTAAGSLQEQYVTLLVNSSPNIALQPTLLCTPPMHSPFVLQHVYTTVQGYGNDKAKPLGVYPECWTDGQPNAGGKVPHPGVDCGKQVANATLMWLQAGGRRIDHGDSYEDMPSVGAGIKVGGGRCARVFAPLSAYFYLRVVVRACVCRRCGVLSFVHACAAGVVCCLVWGVVLSSRFSEWEYSINISLFINHFITKHTPLFLRPRELTAPRFSSRPRSVTVVLVLALSMRTTNSTTT
jgi:hypothetical protein